MRTLAAFCVAVVFALPAWADEWTKRFAVSGTPELRVQAGDGGVTLTPGPAGAIQARVTTRGWKIGPDEVRVVDHQTGNRVELEIRIPSEHFSFGNHSVRVDLTVPPELNAEIHTGDGGIDARGLKGRFRFDTGDGGIRADSLDGTVQVHTGDGGVRVRGRFDVLDATTGDGGLDITADAGSKMTGPWRIRTGDGGVALRLPEGFAADIDARTGDGHIDIRVPVTTRSVESGHSVRGQLNGGGQLLRIETGDGSIRVDRM